MSEYAAAGRAVAVPSLPCPDCGMDLARWSGYRRWVRDRVLHLVWVRRGRCRRCDRTHALLPDLVLERRLDAVEVIGGAIVRSIRGAGMRRTALAQDLPASTVRDWRRRLRARAPALLALFAPIAVGLGDDLADLPAGTERAALAAMAAAWARTRERRPDGVGGMWRYWSAVCGGRALASNTDPRLGDTGSPV